MKLFSKPAASFDDVARGYEHAIDPNTKSDFNEIHARGEAVIAFERLHGVDEARRVLAREKVLADRVAVFRKQVAQLENLSDGARRLAVAAADGEIEPHALEAQAQRVDDRSHILKITKAVVETLEGYMAAVQKQKAALPGQSILDAAKPDPIYDRTQRAAYESWHDERVARSAARTLTPKNNLAPALA